MYIGVDPGITFCGVSVIDNTGDVPKVLETITVKGNIKLRSDSLIETRDRFGERAAKVERICNVVNELVVKHKITHLGIEAPFYGKKSPAAFSALLEVVLSIRDRVAKPHKLTYYEYAPSTAKKVFSGHGGSKKPEMLLAMDRRKKDKTIICTKPTDELTEHEIDSIGVAFTVIDTVEKKK